MFPRLSSCIHTYILFWFVKIDLSMIYRQRAIESNATIKLVRPSYPCADVGLCVMRGTWRQCWYHITSRVVAAAAATAVVDPQWRRHLHVALPTCTSHINAGGGPDVGLALVLGREDVFDALA